MAYRATLRPYTRMKNILIHLAALLVAVIVVMFFAVTAAKPIEIKTASYGTPPPMDKRA